MTKDEKKTVELWDGYVVTIDETKLNDFNFMAKFTEIQKDGSAIESVQLVFELVGGKPTYDKVEKHITERRGYFAIDDLTEIVNKITDALPKA